MITTYLFNKSNYVKLISIQRQAISIIKSFFNKYQTLVGKPIFTVLSNKVIVEVFYYSSKDSISNTQMSLLGNALSQCWNKEIELRLIHLKNPILDSSIFVEFLTSNVNKYSFNTIHDILKSSLPIIVSEGSIDENSILPQSEITGIKIKLSGRLVTERAVPRKTVQSSRIGSSAKGLYGTVDYSKNTSKNKLGAFNMKIWISQHSK